MKFQKRYLIGTLLVAVVAIGAGVTQKFATDDIKFGLATSGHQKTIEVDVGDGANNPKIFVTLPDKTFNLNKALNIVNNQMKLGDGTNGNQVWEFDIGLGAANPKISYDSTLLALSFANDGVNFKKLGSGGSGLGVNFFQDINFDFEAALINWLASGGAFVEENTTPLFGNNSGSFTATAANQNLSSDLIAVPEGALSRACQLNFDYKFDGASAGDMTVRVEDNNSVTLASWEVPPSSDAVPFFASFNCPTATGSSVKVVFEASTATSTLLLDNVFLGTGRVGQYVSDNVFSVAFEANTLTPTIGDTQAAVIREQSHDYFQNCTVTSVATSAAATSSNYSRVYNCNIAGLTERPICVSAAAAPTDPRVTSISVSGSTGAWELNVATYVLASASSATSLAPSVICQKVGSDINTVSEAVNYATQRYDWEGSISGNTTQLNIGTASTQDLLISGTNYQVNNIQGQAQIACGPGESPSGATCAGPEFLGIAIVPQTTGRHRICGNLLTKITSVAGSGTSNLFYFAEVNPSDHSFVATSDDYSRGGNFSGSGSLFYDHHNICYDFDGVAGSKKIIYIAYSVIKLGANNITSNELTTSGSFGPTGAYLFKYRIENLDEKKPHPVFTDLTDELNLKVNAGESIKMCSFQMTSTENNSGLLADYGGCLLSTVDIGAAQLDINFLPGFFNGVNPVICSCQSLNAALTNIGCVTLDSPTKVTLRTFLSSTGASTDAGISVTCVGKE